MAAALEETPVSYEDLADIEKEFDDVETEISMHFLRFDLGCIGERADGEVIRLSDCAVSIWHYHLLYLPPLSFLLSP